MSRIFVVLLLGCSVCCAADLTGNWVVRDPLPDGTVRRTYFDLQEDGGAIRGHIRTRAQYYEITESTGGSEGFTLTGTMHDGSNVRTAKYEGKLVGDELHVSPPRRPDAPLVEMVAHRTQGGEGAMPRVCPCPFCIQFRRMV